LIKLAAAFCQTGQHKVHLEAMKAKLEEASAQSQCQRALLDE
jgi:hypothetical protein